MARSDRRTSQQRAKKQGSAPRHAEAPPLNEEQREALTKLIGRTASLAKELRDAQSGGRDALIEAISPLDQEDEAVMLAYAAHLATVRGAEARDAADVAQALGELAARREVAREARRSRLRLRSAGFPSSLNIPAGPPAITATDGHELTPPTPITSISSISPQGRWRRQLVEALATRTRESGEIALLLAWQEGMDPESVRGYSIALDFWHIGVSGYSVSEPMSRTRFHREIAETLQMDGQRVPTVKLTWAGARRLLQEALAINEWRGTEPVEEFQKNRALIEERLLAEPDDDEASTEIAEEAIRFGREGDRPLIGNNLEADETVANWLGAWCFGDYGLTWDVLSDDNPLRKGATRDEYIALRRQWASEADLGALRLMLIREQPQRASALWTPASAGRLAGSSAKELEVFWSVTLHETPLAGQLDEMPMATLVSQETGRHWYWTAYTVARDAASGLWLISRQRDEGAASQTLTVEELQKRAQEARDTAEKTAQTVPENPRDPRAMEVVRAVTGALATVLHYDDALIVKLPLDEATYRTAIDDARTMNNHERAAALLERMLGRFSDQTQTRFELGVEQYLVSEQYGSQGEEDAANTWLDRAIATMTTVAEQDPTAEHLQAVAELLSRRGDARAAEEKLREALKLDASRASAHADLSSVLMARVSGEADDEPEELTEEQQKPLIREALSELREAARLDGSLPGIFTRMGAIYEVLGQPEDARIAYEGAIERDAQDATAHYALGSMLLGRQEDAAALPHFEAAVQLEPLAVSFRLALAANYIALNRSREATRELDLIDRLQPNLPQARELREILARQQHQKK